MLSQRLLMNAAMVPIGSKVADIGCDHGFISIYLCEQKIADKVIAMDVNRGPLEQAKKHIEEAGFSTVIECRLSDGIEKLLPGEADTLLIGGMGGDLTVSILSARPELLHQMRHLILQPQSELEKVRHFLHNNRFCIEEERMVWEDGKFYTCIHAVPGEQHFENEIEYIYGYDLIKKKDNILRKHLQNEHTIYETIGRQLDSSESEKAGNRRKEVAHRLSGLKELLRLMDT